MEIAIPSGIVLESLLRQWLLEDIGRGDVTTQGLLLSSRQGRAEWVVKEEGIIAGLTITAKVFKLLDQETIFTPIVAEGQFCSSGTKIAEIEGNIEALLSGERTALNLAMLLSGIATETKRYVDQIADLPAKMVDTRKTTPGLRILEKYATRVGGAINHRMGLDDAVMIKDNHIAIVDSLLDLIKKAKKRYKKFEVEVENTSDAVLAAKQGATIIMLDNFSPPQIKRTIKVLKSQKLREKALLEASGGINFKNISIYGQTGVDIISVGSITNSVKGIDMSLEI